MPLHLRQGDEPLQVVPGVFITLISTGTHNGSSNVIAQTACIEVEIEEKPAAKTKTVTKDK